MIDVSELSIEEIALRIVRPSSGRRAGGSDPVKPKPPVPTWRWALWYALLGAALVRLLRPLHAVLVRAALARVDRRVPGARRS